MASVTEGGRRGDSGCHTQRHSQRRGKGSLGWEGQRPLGTLVGAMALELTGEHRCNCAEHGAGWVSNISYGVKKPYCEKERGRENGI